MSLIGRVGARVNQALNTRLGLARLTGLVGVILTFVGLPLQLALVWVLLDGQNRDRIEELATQHAFAALLALLGVLLSKRPLLSAPILFVAFVGSFLAGFGWYLLLTPSPLALASLGGVLYLVSAVTMVVAALAGPSRHD